MSLAVEEAVLAPSLARANIERECYVIDEKQFWGASEWRRYKMKDFGVLISPE